MLYIKNKWFFHWLPRNIKQHNANSLLLLELWLASLLSTVVDGGSFRSFTIENLNIKFSKSFSMTDTKTCCRAPESHCLRSLLDSIPLISQFCRTVSGLAWLFEVVRPRQFFSFIHARPFYPKPSCLPIISVELCLFSFFAVSVFQKMLW